MKAYLFYNSKSGTFVQGDVEVDELIQLVKKHSAEYEVIPKDIIETDLTDIKNIITTGDIAVAAGGDGTISSVVENLLNTEVPIGVLPLGSFNYFAQDCGISLELEEAVKTVFNGKQAVIDTAEVNGRTFINNCALGLYPKGVKLRQQHQNELGMEKFSALFLAVARTFRKFPLISVELMTDQKKTHLKTSFIMIGNNEFSFDLLNVGRRFELSRGKLWIYYAKCRNRFCMFQIAVKALLGMLSKEDDFEYLATDEVILNTRKKKIDVSIDGDVFELDIPIKFKINPGSLRVIIPQDSEV